MNFWHIQLHPDNQNKFAVEKLKGILDLGVIGMSYEWPDKHGNPVDDPKNFREVMMIGDIVMVRDSITPVALVEVTSDWLQTDKINDDLDWFDLRRKVKVLDYFADDIKVLQEKVLAQYGNSYLQAMGTLSRCANDRATSAFIKRWYRIALKKDLMYRIRLEESRKEELRTLWNDFKTKYFEKDKPEIERLLLKIDTKWQEYREKIVDGTLTIDDYTNRVAHNKSYLCNFLERDSKRIYGSSKPGNAFNFVLKLNENGKYTYLDIKNNNKKTELDREEAIQAFNTDIKPFLEQIVQAQGVLNKIEAVENWKYPAKQILGKMVALDCKGELLYMYSSAVDILHDEFLDSEEDRRLGKSYEVRMVANELFNVDPTDDVTSTFLSRFLWRYANSKGIADVDSPNVILYGPPGTGKTYSIRRNLDFICQGDSRRYKIVQFHPSFTYEDFIEGIKPKGMTKDGNIKFQLVNGGFKKFCKEARAELIASIKNKRPVKEYYYVVDEINRANLSAVFGETLVGIEKEYRDNGVDTKNLLKTQYSSLLEDIIDTAAEGSDEKEEALQLAYHYENGEAYFGIPSNLRFIGMMNDVDKSIDAFDLALRRRFKWIRKDCDYDVIEDNVLTTKGKSFTSGSLEKYVKSCKILNEYISNKLGLGKSYQFGHSFFMQISKVAGTSNITGGNLKKLFDLYLSPTLNEYLRSMYSESELETQLNNAKKQFVKLFESKKK